MNDGHSWPDGMIEVALTIGANFIQELKEDPVHFGTVFLRHLIPIATR